MVTGFNEVVRLALNGPLQVFIPVKPWALPGLLITAYCLGAGQQRIA
jgi:hypothetical protein